MEIKQYQVVLVNLEPTLGSEIKKTRPCVVLSPNEMNQYLNTVVVAPMTTTDKAYPTRVKVRHKKRDGRIAIDQIRTIDKQRIIQVSGMLSEKEIHQCKAVLKATFVD